MQVIFVFTVGKRNTGANVFAKSPRRWYKAVYINFLKIDFACVKFRGQVQIQIVYKYVLSVCSDF